MSYFAPCIVIICSFMIRTYNIGSDIYLYHTDGPGPHYIHMGLALTTATAYLLYPLLGWLSDVYFTRYKVIRLAFIILVVAMGLFVALATVATVIPIDNSKIETVYFYATTAVSVPLIVVSLIGAGLFEANAIQFGMDQMLEASSDQLSTFIHWYYWSINLGQLLVTSIALGVLLYYSSCKITAPDSLQSFDFIHENNILLQIIFGIAVIQVALGVIGLCLLICTKKQLNIERPGHNPLKLIYKVLKYAWNHTCPENRSAFTYWEEDIPPRIDLGKNKYGGPFTTEEVEDTKSFLRILLLLCSLVGFHLSGHGYSLSDQLMRRECPSFWILMLVGNPTLLSTLIILIGVPLHQLLAFHCCQRYFPNMLKRLGLGLLCCLLKAICEIVLQATQTNSTQLKCPSTATSPLAYCYFQDSLVVMNDTCSNFTALTDNKYYCTENNTTFLLLIIPHGLQGIAYLLVFMTAIEFICAQAPLRLKGLLIGLWYASLSICYLLVEIPETYITGAAGWQIFHEVKAFLIAMCLFLYLYVSERYHYRIRDEVVNEQFLVEEVYEREFQLAEEYEREKRAEMRALYGDPVNRPPQYGATKEKQDSS